MLSELKNQLTEGEGGRNIESSAKSKSSLAPTFSMEQVWAIISTAQASSNSDSNDAKKRKHHDDEEAYKAEALQLQQIIKHGKNLPSPDNIKGKQTGIEVGP